MTERQNKTKERQNETKDIISPRENGRATHTHTHRSIQKEIEKQEQIHNKTEQTKGS